MSIREHDTRANTKLLMEMMDEGILNSQDIAEQLMMWLPESDVTSFVRYYEYDTMQGAYEE
jgi:hypothetical protein